MKKALLTLLVLLVPALALAAGERDDILTAGGILYTVESVNPPSVRPGSSSDSKALLLTVQDGNGVEAFFIPATMNGGSHSQPALAYDEPTQTLFVFWQKQPSRMSSELLVAGFRAGVWSAPLTIENSIFSYATNLRIGTTRYVTVRTNSGHVRNQTTVFHVIWWEENPDGEFARYSLITLSEGSLYAGQPQNLIEFVPERNLVPIPLAPDFDRQFFRQPAIFEQPDRDTVQIMFADWDTNRLHRVNVKPVVGNGVLHVPDGVWKGEIGPPKQMANLANLITFIPPAPGSTSLAFYFSTEKSMKYMIFQNGSWGEMKSLALSEGLTLQTGVDALKKLLKSE